VRPETWRQVPWTVPVEVQPDRKQMKGDRVRIRQTPDLIYYRARAFSRDDTQMQASALLVPEQFNRKSQHRDTA